MSDATTAPKRVLFLVQHRPNRSPGQRYRHEQYLGLLAANGFELHYSPLLSRWDDSQLYRPGRYLLKAWILLKNFYIRLRDTLRAKKFDLVFVYREAFFTGTTWFEREIKAAGVKMIFDFDDAIWQLNTSEGNRRLAFLKNPSKTPALIAMSDLVLAGNAYLAEYARRFNPRTVVFPTTVDTQLYDPARYPRTSAGSAPAVESGPPAAERPVVIGWSGSPTTVPHFELAVPALLQIKEKYGPRVAFRLMGDGAYRHEALGIVGEAWTAEAELPMLASFDIGIMPLPDDEWAKGKCGLKGLVYMAMGLPALLSPVGVNNDIIQDGVNGFLPRSQAQWVERLSQLIEDPDLRNRLGQAGRETVEARYSVQGLGLSYVNLYRSLAGLPELTSDAQLQPPRTDLSPLTHSSYR